MKIRVYYEDTDVGGVVYYANYLKFCERARSEAFFEKGLNPFDINGHFLIKSLNANYINSAKLGDMIEVKTSILEIKAASFKLYQEIFKDDKKLFEMEVTLVYVGYDSKVKKITSEIKELIKSIFV